MHTEKPVALATTSARARRARGGARRAAELRAGDAARRGAADGVEARARREARRRFAPSYAEANWGRIERWHPSPEALYEVGPLVDVGIYPLTILTAMFGPVRRVSAYATTLQPERMRRDGAGVHAPDAGLLRRGARARGRRRGAADGDFYWVGPDRQRGIEFHGDEASLWMPTWGEFDSRLAARRATARTRRRCRTCASRIRGIDWAAALVDLAEAVASGPAAPDGRRARGARASTSSERSRRRRPAAARSRSRRTSRARSPLDWAA